MSIYSELLQLALTVEQDEQALATTEELVDRLADYAVRLARHVTEPSGGRAAHSAASDLTADLIAHDVALVQLCERYGIPQSLTDPHSRPDERDRLIAYLAEKHIEFQTLSGTGPGDGIS